MSEYGLQSKKKIHNGGMIATGILLTVAGALCFLWPGATLITLTIIAGIGFIATAIVEFIFAREVQGTFVLGPWVIGYGVIDLLIGIVLVLFPTIFSSIFPWIIATIFIVMGIFEIIGSFTGKEISRILFILMLASGIIGVLFGIILFKNPGFVVMVLGIYLLFRGVMLVIHGWNAGYDWV